MKNRIKEFRKAKGLTQQEVADQFDVDVRVIGFMETGKTPLTSVWLGRLAKIFGCAPHELITPEPRRIPVRFCVGASDDYNRVRSLTGEFIEETAPFVHNATPQTVAVRICGFSMGKHLDGWYAYFNEPMITPASPDFDALAARRVGCIVLLEDETVFAKIFSKSKEKGLYYLESVNGTLEPCRTVWGVAEIIAYARD